MITLAWHSQVRYRCDYCSFDSHIAANVTSHLSLQHTPPVVEQVVAGDPYYIGVYTVDGSWRIRRSGVDILVERRESGSWIYKATFVYT